MRTAWLRGVVATVGAAGLCVGLLALARANWALVLGPGALRPADVLLALLCSGGSLLACWLTLGLVLAAFARLPGTLGRASAALGDRVTPAAARRTVALLLGTSMAAAVAPGTAVATSPAPGRHPVTTASAARVPGAVDRADPPEPSTTPRAAPDPGFRPTPRQPSAPATLGPMEAPPRTSSAATDPYVVRRGDTLWAIAARTLGPGAPASAVAREWPRWHAANRAVIGPDPSVIRPGQRLSPPPAPQDGAR